VRRSLFAAGVACALVAGACSDDSPSDDAGTAPIDECDWAMWGHDLAASYTQPCDTRISPQSVDDLGQAWFTATDDVVTASPAVVDRTLYIGDWSGKFYAFDTDTGEPRWTYETDVHPTVYAGQIVSSAAVADVDGERTVYFGGGKTLYALRADDGSEVWRHEVGRPGDDEDPTEIESSPIVVDDTVLFGFDVHNSSGGEPAGLRALDATSGNERWTFQTAPTTGDEPTGSGCGDVWGSPSVDRERGLVFFGTGNCTSDEWGRFSEAIVAVDLERGDLRWSYQPHDPNHDDLDFAGMPNLFDVDGRPVVGLGNKDGAYYAVDRETGDEVWRAPASGPGLERPGSNFSTGGFIGSTGVSDGLVVGGIAIGSPPPFLYGIDAATGATEWEQPTPAATYASVAIANGVGFLGGTDFTLRAFDLADGRILWEHEMPAVIAGGAAIVGDDVYAVAGLREPGLEPDAGAAGVAKFSLGVETAESTTTTGAGSEPTETAAPGSQPCLGEPCEMDFFDTPAGLDPRVELAVELDPWTVTVRARGLGPPDAWVRPGSPDAAVGATAYAAFMSERDSNPTGGLLCVLDENLECESDQIPTAGATYNRITILALEDPTQFPSVASGVNRLVATVSFDPPLGPEK